MRMFDFVDDRVVDSESVSVDADAATGEIGDDIVELCGCMCLWCMVWMARMYFLL